MRILPALIAPAALLLIAAYPAKAADPALPGYLAPDTNLVVGIQVRSVLDAVAKNGGAALLGKSAGLMAQTPLAGFDPLKDLDEVLIATSGTGQKAPALVVMHGRFDVARLGEKAKRYQGVPILEDPKGKSGAMALLDASTALAGEMPLVCAAIDRQQRGAAARFSWAGRIESLKKQYAVWGVGEGMEGLNPGAAAKGQADLMNSVDRFAFGAAFSQGLDVAAELHMRSPKDLERMSATLAMVQAMMKANPKQAPTGAKFGMETDNGTLKLTVHVPAEELKKAVEQQSTAIASAVLSQLPGDLASRMAPQLGLSAVAKGFQGSRAVASTESTIVSNEQGETVVVTLPGKK